MSTDTDRPRVLLTFLWAIAAPPDELAALVADGVAAGALDPLGAAADSDWAVVDGFLRFVAEPPQRYRLRDTLTIAVGGRRHECAFLLTSFAAHGVITLLASVPDVGDPDRAWPDLVDPAIAVLQSFQGRAARAGGGAVTARYRGAEHACVHLAVTRLVADLAGDRFPDGLPLNRRAWCAELRDHRGRRAVGVAAQDPRPLYGLGYADEGWRFVAPDAARQALDSGWGSRDFFHIYALPSSIVCLNGKHPDYAAGQDRFTTRYFGAVEPYFSLDTPVAGLDHGGLLALERVMVRVALTYQWLERAQAAIGRGRSRRRDLRDRRLLRSSLDEALQLISTALMPEIDNLERLLAHRSGADRLVARLDRLAEAMDQETQYLYSKDMSGYVTRLTWLTIALTVATVILGVVQVLVTV
ncbi:hypothetical protein GCM10010123_07530 [Pilimelia anulata]|uniref:Uncharacterized protein n=1 Tax=Pilimelia anulata TaxID=53371 RepID=A0A8J3B7U1_9ACTN|nr:hypothetical protein [Pilimelia anulata]GGJ80145.1 hypothetical protein GCM10010123_07530 [Pilimelia anulata]